MRDRYDVLLCLVLAMFAILPSVVFYLAEPEHVVLFGRIFIAVCRGLLRYIGIYV